MLLLQAKLVRKRMPDLPDAAGPTTGLTQGPASPLRLLILGESSVSGVGAPSHKEAFVGQIASGLARRIGRAVRWHAVGETGITAREAHQRLLPRLAGKKADLVAVSLGVNDVAQFTSLSRWRRDLGALLDGIESRLQGARIVLFGMPPMGRFPALPQPLRAVLGLRARALDAAAARLAHRRPGARHLPLNFAGDIAHLFSADGVHLGPDGHAAWGAYFAERLGEMLSAGA